MYKAMLLLRQFSISIILFGIFLTLSTCDDATIKDKTIHNVEAPEMRRARLWADKQLAQMDLPQKVGQLILAIAPGSTEPDLLAAYIEVLNQFHIGGILLQSQNRNDQAAIATACQAGTRFPLWVGLDADAVWADTNGFGYLLNLGAANVDSLARNWGKAIGIECQNLGAHLCFSSVAKVSPRGQALENSFGEDPERIIRLSTEFLHGLKEEGTLPCLRVLPATPKLSQNFPMLAGSPRQIWQKRLGPLNQLLSSNLGLLQTTHTILSEIDSLPGSLSAKVSSSLIRYGLNYKGLLFSPPFRDSIFSQMYPAGVAERMALQAGIDVIVAPADPVAVIDEVLRSVEAGLMSASTLDASVHKVLLQKALAGLDTLANRPIDSLAMVENFIKLKATDYRIAENAITLVWDKNHRIPLRGKIGNAKIATLAIGASRPTSMQSMMEAYASLSHFSISENAHQKKLEAQLLRFKKYDYVLVELHHGMKGDTLSTQLKTFLSALDRQNKLVITVFGKLNLLAELDALSCVIAAYDDRKVSQQIAGQYIWGGIAAAGSLPVNVCGRYCLGEGLNSGKKIRLEYVEPEVLGIDPGKLAQVDSIINTAIWMGTFPGCQVLAAKDGKVFLHKSYGHHDYNRSRRVRLSDVYDIASVTKIAATTLMAMHAYEQDTLHLAYPIKYYLKELDSGFVTIRNITPRKLMVHQAGLPSGLPVYKYYTLIDSVDSLRSRYYSNHADDSLFTVKIADHLYFNHMYLDTIWDAVRRIKLDTTQGYKYSDVSMFLMKEVLERIYATSLDKYVTRSFYRPLGLQTLGYYPLDRMDLEKVAPTEMDGWWRKQQLRGHVHDHSTALFGGVGGQAGLFSNVRDLATIMQMLLNEGEYGGKRYFKRHTVRKFTSRQPGSHRGLGFDMQRPVPVQGKGYCCANAAPTTFGHFGFTGTCTWADPENQIIYVLLTNRVYPKARNWKINSFRVRQAVQEAIYDALGLGIDFDEPPLLAEEEAPSGTDSLALTRQDTLVPVSEKMN
ncbi:MAG TPA: hypothetical protein ENJ82_07450 [Bacteroidetes bacterium]|nr:hypothetical protein [Bacteroidota bacterium]